MIEEKSFAINANTCTLKYNTQKGGTTILGNDIRYIIPIYQRPYTWGEEQIRKFVSDIFISFWGNDGITSTEPMFIGTMQLSAKNANNEHEIIDGQQRLTTSLLLLKALKLKYNECQELDTLKLDWLRTEVSNGAQQLYLEEATNSNRLLEEDSINPYLQNLALLNEILDEHCREEDDTQKTFDINEFVNHLLSSIYFVVIETRAGLSKTLQIFNAINTTGLDLNGGDIFKIRMYEYLNDKKGLGESSFEQISMLYQKIDEGNAELKRKVTDMRGILEIYQFLIIAKYQLPVTLYNLGTDSFYERLFDTLFNINQWEHFRNNVNRVELSLEDIDRIIEVRYAWERQDYNTAEDAAAMHFIWWSRYRRYWTLIFVFLNSYSNEENYWDKFFYFVRQLSRLFLIYSIRFQKIKNEIFYGFMHKVIHTMVHGSPDELMHLINNQIATEAAHNNGFYDLNYFIGENLTQNTKRKNLLCRLSALLEEDYKTKNQDEINRIKNLLFENKIDIEHIQSFHDKDGNLRQDIWQLWGDEINSIGNLMVLEQAINRSISNHVYLRKIDSKNMHSYHNSKFAIVRSHVRTNPREWTLANSIQRKETETRKILNYLFDKEK